MFLVKTRYYNFSHSICSKYQRSCSNVRLKQVLYHSYTTCNLQRKPRGYWADENNRRQFLLDLAETKNIKNSKDWEQLGRKGIVDAGGSNLLRYYSSWKDAVSTLLPNFSFESDLAYLRRIIDRFLLQNNVTSTNQLLKEYSIDDIKEYFRNVDDIDECNSLLLDKFNSLRSLLRYVYSSKELDVFKYNGNNDKEENIIPLQSDISYHQLIVEKFAKENNLSTNNVNGWDGISVKQFREYGMSGLLQKYGGKLKLLENLFPETDWNSSIKSYYNVTSKEQYYWKNIENQKIFFDEFAKKHNIVHPMDWKRISTRKFIKEGGKQILKYYPSLFDALKTIYPEYTWVETDYFPIVPLSYWQNYDNQKQFLDYLSKKYNLDTLEKWKLKGLQYIKKEDGMNSLKYFDIGLKRYLKELFFKDEEGNMENNLLEFAYYFDSDYWDNKKNQRLFFDYLQNINNIEKQEDWKNISIEYLKKKGAHKILSEYSSLFNALKHIYPEKEWDIYNVRKQSPKEYWEDDKNVKEFIDKFEQKMNIQSHNDWYRISVKQIQNEGGSGLLKLYDNNLKLFLNNIYPNVIWNSKKLKSTDKRSRQRWMFICLQRLFKDKQIIEEFLLSDDNYLKRQSGMSVEIDVFIPELLVGFEFQGNHHYYDIPKFGQLELYQSRDEEKQKIALESNILIVNVPYWWNDSEDGLKEYIEESIENNIELTNNHPAISYIKSNILL